MWLFWPVDSAMISVTVFPVPGTSKDAIFGAICASMPGIESVRYHAMRMHFDYV
jgi:hypothetical protein